MPAIKRSGSDLEEDDVQPTPKKVVILKLCSSKDARIKELESQIAALNDFVIDTKIDKELPSPIIEQLQHHPGAAEKLDTAIRTWIEEEDADCPADEPSRSSVLSKRNVKYIADVERLSNLPEGLERAFHLALFLGQRTVDWEATTDVSELEAADASPVATEEDSGTEEDQDEEEEAVAKEDGGERPSDEPLDTLLVRLIRRLRRKDNNFNPLQEFTELAILRAKFEVRDFESPGYFTYSSHLMWSLSASPEAIQEFHDDLKEKFNSLRIDSLEQGKDAEKLDWFERFRESLVEHNIILEIRKLGHMSMTGSRLALELILFTKRRSLPTRISRYKKRRNESFEDEMDEVLSEIATAIKEEDLGFRPESVVETLKYENALFKEHNIPPHFKKSYNLLLSWLPETAKSEAIAATANLKARIKNAADLINQRLKPFTKDGGLPHFDWLGDRLKDFIPDIKELSTRPAGLLGAIALVIFLGVSSYPRAAICNPLYGHEKSTYNIKRLLDQRCDEFLLKMLSQYMEKCQLS